MVRTTTDQQPTAARQRQSGQVLLLALLLAMVGAFLLLALFSGGQALATRERLVASADAAALSAATWRARMLNTVAYTNRAIVAQEVALAQAATLASWARHFEALSNHADTLASLYPPAGVILGPLQTLAHAGRLATDEAVGLEQAWRAGTDWGDKVWLARSQEWWLRSADVFALGALANEVVRASDPRFFAFALSDAGEFSRFAAKQESTVQRERVRNVVLASLDAYTAQPRHDDTRLLLPSSCVGRSSHFDRWTLWLRRRGGTALHDTLETWSAIDTTSLHDWRPRGFLGLGGCTDRETLALGWGGEGMALAAGAGQTDAQRVNPGAAALAGAQFGAGAQRLAGLPLVHDLAGLEASAAPRTRLAVLARIDTSSLRTVDRLGLTLGRLRLRDGKAPDRLLALSSAEVFFQAPPEAGVAAQRPSLFSPFWQARLSEPSPTEQALAHAYAR